MKYFFTAEYLLMGVSLAGIWYGRLSTNTVKLIAMGMCWPIVLVVKSRRYVVLTARRIAADARAILPHKESSQPKRVTVEMLANAPEVSTYKPEQWRID